MAAKSSTPVKDIALLALNGSDAFPGDMLEDVLTYCFDQLCWHRSSPGLVKILNRLEALVTEEI